MKGSSLFVVWMLAASLVLGLVSLLAAPAAAAPCERSGGPTAGDWTVSNGQVCDGITIVMDGNLIITGAGSLTINNGGLKFVEDTAHTYLINVNAGGRLLLQSSKIWTETNLVNPYLKLDVVVGGNMTLQASTLAFPGTVDVAAGGVLNLWTGSLIRPTESNVNDIFSLASGLRDDNDDAPGLTFTSSTVNLYASRIEGLYENAGLGAPDPRQSIRLQGATVLTAIDTFLGIDFCCVTASSVATHNTLGLTGTSRAFLYGVSVDTSETTGQTQDQWVSAITTAAGTGAHLYRWANVRVVDANGVPVDAADLNANFQGAETGPANYSDNPGQTYPPSGVRWYLGGKTDLDWDDTDASGTVLLPLVSDWIDSSTQPDSRFVGTFQLTATSGVHSGVATLTFASYPTMDAGSASKSATIQLTTLTQPLPDLTSLPPTFVPATPKEGQTVSITAPVANQGAGGAANILVRIFDGVTLLTETTIPFLAPAGQQNVLSSLPNATGGQHVIRVSVDPNNAIIEGPAGSPPESNNLKGYQLSVTPRGPDLEVDVSFNPDPGFLNNPVQLIAGVTNIGDLNATNVAVNFYVQGNQPDASSTPVGSATIPFVDIGGVGTASVNWTPTSTTDFTVWAWADPDNVIPEPAPYSEANNLRSNILSVTPAPDLVTFPQDLTMSDPYPRVGQPVTLEATVRNNGQATSGVGFRVDFLVDGVVVDSRNLGALVAGQKVTTTSTGPVTFSTCGAHTIGVNVDPLNAVNEGSLYELNNQATAAVQAYPTLVYSWATGGTIDADQAFSRNLEIASAVTVTGASITVVQDQDPCGRYYVKVLAGGSLTMTNAALTSNWPLTVFVSTGGTLTATGSMFNLDTQGRGALSSKGTLTVWNSVVGGDLIARGVSADLRGDTLSGSLVHVDTTLISRIWDTTFPGVATIELASDAPGAAAVDFDLRNLTFDPSLTAQLVFSGDQWAQLTSVSLSKPGDWWTGMLTQSAHVTRYWWLTVETVDGTGTRIQDPTTVIGLTRFNPVTLLYDALSPCAAGDCYFNSNNSWMVGTPQGLLLYRAAAEERYGPTSPQTDVVQATYRADGYANIEGAARKPDNIESALVVADTTITLVFSELTPDLAVGEVRFDGQNGNNVNSQPIGRALNIVANITNSGQIITRNVMVNCYEADVDVNRDGYMDNPHASYVNALAFIGSAGPLDVSALGFALFTCTWTPTGALEGSRTISVVVDPSTGGNPRDGGAIAELDETNNLLSQNVVIFTWPDLHFAADPVVSFDPPTPIVNNPVTLTVEVTNEGTNTATLAVFDVTGGSTATKTVTRAQTTTVTLVWTPLVSGLVTVQIRVQAAGAVFPGEFRNYDFDLADNTANKQFNVVTQPELSIA
ncbi:MAG TPA: CARDB domain-containing protein, partial [Thermoplasmata archaeon]|nr:CARDB domain-containing protein [Thermoplasmata archaeon]